MSSTNKNIVLTVCVYCDRPCDGSSEKSNGWRLSFRLTWAHVILGHVVSHEWLDTRLQGSNRTNNRNNATSPKTITAAKIIKQEQLTRAATLQVIFQLISHLTRMLEADLPAVQWAAVTTHCSSTKVPPQNPKPRDVINACQGQAPLGASVPPTILDLGLYPHFPDPPPPPPPPPPHLLQLFLQFSSIYFWNLPLQYPWRCQRGQFRFLSSHPKNIIFM